MRNRHGLGLDVEIGDSDGHFIEVHNLKYPLEIHDLGSQSVQAVRYSPSVNRFWRYRRDYTALPPHQANPEPQEHPHKTPGSLHSAILGLACWFDEKNMLHTYTPHKTTPNSHTACVGRSHPLLRWSDTEETRQPQGKTMGSL